MAMWLSRVIMSLMSLSVTLASDSTSLSPILDRSRKVEKCEARQRYGHPDGCGQCAKLIPSFNDADEGEDTWRVAVHIDRAGSITQLDGRHLRGQAWKERAPRRELPHEYFVASMEATLHTISVIDPTAQVHLAVFTEERWGELVDETGTPIDWDIANEICEHLGLICSQVSFDHDLRLEIRGKYLLYIELYSHVDQPIIYCAGVIFSVEVNCVLHRTSSVRGFSQTTEERYSKKPVLQR